MGTEPRGVPRRGSPETEGPRPCEHVIRWFVKLAGQRVLPPGPRASRLAQWAPRELSSPRLAGAIITDLIKMKSETGHVGAACPPPARRNTIITEMNTIITEMVVNGCQLPCARTNGPIPRARG